MSTTSIPPDDPTAPRYACASGCGVLSFQWGKRMPDGGRLGTASCGQFVNKPIQVYDNQPINDSSTGREIGRNWGFQAQDGSFLGRMYVSTKKSFIRFVHFRPNDQWPETICAVTNPDPSDSREGIANAA